MFFKVDIFRNFNTFMCKKEWCNGKCGCYLDVPGVTGQFIAPNESGYEDLNNYSAVLKLTFGRISILFTGDAEEISESEMHKSGKSQIPH